MKPSWRIKGYRSLYLRQSASKLRMLQVIESGRSKSHHIYDNQPMAEAQFLIQIEEI